MSGSGGRVLGISIDAAPTHIGIALWESGEVIKVDQTKATSWIEAIESIWQLTELEDIAWVAIEGCYYHKNPQVFADLNKMLGAVAWWCYEKNIPYFEGKTTEIDKACSIPLGLKREDRKQYTHNVAEMLYSLTPLTEDESDAIAVGLWGYGKYKEYLHSHELLE